MHALLTLLLLTLALARPVQADPFDHQWCRYPSEHYEFITDLPARKVATLAQQMAVFRKSVQPFIHGSRQFEELSIKVVVFRDTDDFNQVLKTPHFSGFMRPSLRQSVLVVSPGLDNRWLTENALHEYTHYLLRNRVDVRIPTWYDEGLASLLSTADITRRGVVLGRAPTRLLRGALRGTKLSLAEVLETEVLYDLPLEQLNDLYLTSWALMHYISFGTHRTKELEAYLRNWGTPLPDALQLTMAELEAELDVYLKRGRLPRVAVARPAVTVTVGEPECLTDLERDHELVELTLYHDQPGALEQLRFLHDRAPEFVPALLSLAAAHQRGGRPHKALEYAERALALAPNDVEAKIRVALTLSQQCMYSRVAGCNAKWQRAVSLFEQALQQDPQRSDARLGLGVAYLHRNQAEDAAPHLRAAYERAPWAPLINLYLGEAYRMLADPRARGLLTNALNWSDVQIIKRLATAALGELNEVDG